EEIEAASAEADEEAQDRQVDPAIVGREVEQAGGDREVQDRADEHLAPADAIGDPAPDIGAEDGAHARAQENDGGLAEGELPRPDQESEDEGDQEEIEEFERIADDRGGEDLLLIAGQSGLPVENIEHGISPRGVSCALLFWGPDAAHWHPVPEPKRYAPVLDCTTARVCPSKCDPALLRCLC